MEGIGELQNCLAPLLPQYGPSHVLVLIVSNRVILFLYRIHKKIPSGIDPIYSRFLCGTFLPVSFPPIFYMGESLKECEGDLFPIGEIMNIEITL
jgi:fucose permease